MISAIILAAGLSRRMGVQKLLLPVGGQTMIARIVDEVLSSPVNQVFVVIGHEGRRITEALADRRVTYVTNTSSGAEMLSSVRCGLRALPEKCIATLVALGDQPNITADVVDMLMRAYRKTGRGIVVPTCGGRRGHPLLFAMHYRDEILTRYEKVGLRGLLHAHPEDVLELEVATSGILEDMDVPEDYARTVAKFYERND